MVVLAGVVLAGWCRRAEVLGRIVCVLLSYVINNVYKVVMILTCSRLGGGRWLMLRGGLVEVWEK